MIVDVHQLAHGTDATRNGARVELVPAYVQIAVRPREATMRAPHLTLQTLPVHLGKVCSLGM